MKVGQWILETEPRVLWDEVETFRTYDQSPHRRRTFTFIPPDGLEEQANYQSVLSSTYGE
jgi:hypothetical protein